MIIENKVLDEERALYGLKDALVKNCAFEGEADGESALKETENIRVENCRFALRYPFWHTNGGAVSNCKLLDSCRAAFWYDSDIVIKNSNLGGIKAVRECDRVEIDNCKINSSEFGWICRGLKIKNSSLVSEYPFFNSRDIEINNFQLQGKYSFQYVENMVIRNSRLYTKDAFWHGKNITVYDSVVSGEYLGWYSENLKFVRCKIIGTQPLCYCKGLVLEDCEMERCDLSFENSEVKATVKGYIDSVKNPTDGFIKADKIGEIILDQDTNCKIEV